MGAGLSAFASGLNEICRSKALGRPAYLHIGALSPPSCIAQPCKFRCLSLGPHGCCVVKCKSDIQRAERLFASKRADLNFLSRACSCASGGLWCGEEKHADGSDGNFQSFTCLDSVFTFLFILNCQESPNFGVVSLQTCLHSQRQLSASVNTGYHFYLNNHTFLAKNDL